MRLSINIGLDTLTTNDLSLNDFVVLAIIYSYERNGKPCLLKRDKMAKYLNVSEWTIERTYTKLKKDHYIFIVNKCKKLTAKGAIFCQTFMSFNASKKHKKQDLSLPKWFKEWKEETQSNVKNSCSDEDKAEMKALIEELFPEND